jgi:hypothetical protein
MGRIVAGARELSNEPKTHSERKQRLHGGFMRVS